MVIGGLMKAWPANCRGNPYAASEWLRRAVAPLAASAQWERRHQPSRTRPFGRLDVETAFLLAAPLLELPGGASGLCRLSAELDAAGTRLAGVTAEVADGGVVACSTRLDPAADGWATGPADAWLDAIVDGETERLELGGACALPRALLDSLHGRLFASHP